MLIIMFEFFFNWSGQPQNATKDMFCDLQCDIYKKNYETADFKPAGCKSIACFVDS